MRVYMVLSLHLWREREYIESAERVEKERLILRKWLMHLWSLASLKFVEQAGRLETQRRVAVNFSLKSEG